MNQLLFRAGHRPLEAQVDLGADDWIGRIDLLDRDLRVVVEVQSARFHSSVLDRRRDAERRERLEAAGWLVVEVWDHDVWYRPHAVVSAIVAARLRTARPAA